MLKRIRINVSTSVKGVKTWDATAEMTGEPGDLKIGHSLEIQALELSDWIVKELEQRYPIVVD